MEVENENAKRILSSGRFSARVKRSGMLQVMSFSVKKVEIGADYFVELYTARTIDMPEILRLAEETGLPVEAGNGRAFPKGKGAKDFLNL